MGQPTGSNVPVSTDEYIVRRKGTPGTETSKYREEEKERSISKVAASEMERAQTEDQVFGVMDAGKAKLCIAE